MDELKAIEFLREVTLSQHREALPKNSVQIKRAQQWQEELAVATPLLPTPAPTFVLITAVTLQNNKAPGLDSNYIPGNKDDKDAAPLAKCGAATRQSKRVPQQLQDSYKDGIHHIVSLTAQEKATTTCPLKKHSQRLGERTPGLANEGVGIQIPLSWYYH